jgi:hypothetical protein
VAPQARELILARVCATRATPEVYAVTKISQDLLMTAAQWTLRCDCVDDVFIERDEPIVVQRFEDFGCRRRMQFAKVFECHCRERITFST